MMNTKSGSEDRNDQSSMLKPFSPSAPSTPARPSSFHPDVPPRNPIPGMGASAPADLSAPRPLAEANTLVVGRAIVLKGGEIAACERLTLEGRVEDTTLAKSSVLEIAEGGEFKGTAVVEEAIIAGRFNGDLTARQRLTVLATGIIEGSVQYGTIVIEPGGQISGKMKTIS